MGDAAPTTTQDHHQDHDDEDDPTVRLRTIVAKLSRRLRATVAGGDLTPTTISVLFSVVRLGPLRATRLAEFEGLNPTMLSRVLAQLEALGLVSRAPDPEDRRAVLVAATEAGGRMRRAIKDERRDVLDLQLAKLHQDDRETLERALPVLEELADLLRGDVA